MGDFRSIFKAYDVRGTVPDQFDPSMAERIGAAFARFVTGTDPGSTRVLVARDMRPSGVDMVEAFATGAQSQGLDVVDLGLGSTDLLYFAAGSLDAAVAYISNAAGHADRLDAYPINIPCAFAEQPFAIARDTRHRQLLGRLRDAILGFAGDRPAFAPRVLDEAPRTMDRHFLDLFAAYAALRPATTRAA